MSNVFLALALVVAAVAAFETEDFVIVGTDANFDEVVAAHDFLLVEFYAPWCGHCKTLAPEYASAGRLLENSVPKLMKVDATVHTKAAERFQVQGYPTLKFFKKGNPSEYNGGRTASEIVAWLNKRSGPPAVHATSQAALDKIVEDNEVVVVGFFSSTEDAQYKAFFGAAELGEETFVYTTDAAIAAHYKVTAPAVIVLKKFDEGRADYTGEFTATDIQTFVTGNVNPLVSEFSDAVAPRIFGGPVKTHVLLFASKTSSAIDAHLAAMRSVAKTALGKLLFVFINVDVPENQRIVEFFGLGTSDIPAVRLVNIADEMAKYKPESSEITAEVLQKFADDFLSGNLKKHRRSEATPADWDAKPVKVLTGENFAQVALDPTKSVLVEFCEYRACAVLMPDAPWCGHCKQLAPIWDQLAELFAEHPNVVVAKVDSTANELEDINIQSFPTIKFFPAGEDEEPLDYSGGRDLASLAEYLSGKTGIKVDASAAPTHDHDHDHHDHDHHDHDHDHAGHDHAGHEEL